MTPIDIRFSPFRKRRSGPSEDLNRASADPVPQSLVAKTTTKSKATRKVTIVHPGEEAAYRLKARLLSSGHRHVEVFFLPESFLSVVKSGHSPDVVLIHDFIAEDAGMTGVELARTLRLKEGFGGLIFSTSEDHAAVSSASLEVHGFSGHAVAYLTS